LRSSSKYALLPSMYVCPSFFICYARLEVLFTPCAFPVLQCQLCAFSLYVPMCAPMLHQ
jgi:hypothetical protein